MLARPKKPTGGSRFVKSLRSILGLLAVATLMVIPSTANASLTAVSSARDDAGFPSWYQDASGIKLKLCVDNDLCLGGNPNPTPGQPISILTGNVPDESFYAVARAEATLNGGGRVRYRAVLEGAFANDEVVAGEQVTFVRTQVTGDKINLNTYPRGTKFTFQTPYGDMEGEVQSNGTIAKARQESAHGTVQNLFQPPLSSPIIGPRFIKWDAGAPVGFIGNPLQLHTVTGGSVRNSFVVTRRNNLGVLAPVSPNVTLFEVAGQCAEGTC